MKKTLLISTIALSAFAFQGMHGGMSGKAHNIKPMKGLTENKVLAEANGHKITVHELNGYLQGTKKDFRIKLQELPAQHVGQFVEEYVAISALYPAAKEIEKTDAYKAAAKQIALDLWITKKFNGIQISDKEVKEFYNKYKDIYFKNAPEYKARHIVVKDEKLAQKLISQLKGLKGKALENKFAKLAEKHSIGPSKIDGGELGFFKLEDMAQPFSEAVSKLKIGTITTKPVQTKFGYHVILLEDKKSNVYVDLDKVKLQIVYNLKTKKLNKILDEIKEKANIKYYIKTK
jgi:parvulin-like peptidyl-prolyl isomerase